MTTTACRDELRSAGGRHLGPLGYECAEDEAYAYARLLHSATGITISASRMLRTGYIGNTVTFLSLS